MDIPREEEEEEEEGGAGVLDLVCLFVCLSQLFAFLIVIDTRLGLTQQLRSLHYLPWLYYLAILARCLFPIIFPSSFPEMGMVFVGGWGMGNGMRDRDDVV